MDILSGVLGGIGTVANLIGNIASGVGGAKRQERLQEKAWKREDSAVQRRVADLKKAGMSPILAAGQAAQSSPPIVASKGIEQQQQGVMKGLESANLVMSLMQMRKDFQRTDAEIALLDEQRREKKIRNDALSEESKIIRYDRETGEMSYEDTNITVAQTIARMEAANLMTQGGISYWQYEAQFYGVKQAEYDLMKERIKMNNPGLNETELQLKALAASVIAQQQQNEMQGMNLELYRRTGVAPQLFGAAMGLAGQTIPHGLYRIP